jgi:hypothetical protein
MGQRLETYRSIAKILSPETQASELEPLLQHPDFDWDALVIEGSGHLMLPALYCNLKCKGLLHTLPEELDEYLEEITAINRNRNKAIMLQIKAITELFNTQSINHVLLKGAALLMAEAYEDPAERMIGDIDILVAEDQLNSAFELLQRHGYKPIETTFGADYVEHKHLPRLRTTDYIAAVELHRKLFMDYDHKVLQPSAILKQKQEHHGIWVPSGHQLLLHNILNFQISDYGHLFKAIGFKTIYDHLGITKRFDSHLKDEDLKVPAVASFIKYHKVFFSSELQTIPLALGSRERKLLELRLRYNTLNRCRYRSLYTLNYLKQIGSRVGFVLTKKAYRKALWADRKRIIYTLKRQVIHNKPPH